MTAITVCVPVWNGAAFIAQTLDSVAAQTFPDFKVLISLDRGDDNSEEICRRYLADPRFSLTVQPERLGWVGNVNALIAACDTPFFCIMPHDDILEPGYLAALHALAASDDDIVGVCSDMQGFGDDPGRVAAQMDTRGTVFERVLDILLNHMRAVVFRGLIRVAPDRPPPLLPRLDAADAQSTEGVWMIELALRGEIRRVPQALYRKRYHEASVHAAWMARPPKEMLSQLVGDAAAVTRAALTTCADAEQRDIVVIAGLCRALGLGRARPLAWLPQNDWERTASVAIYRDLMREFDAFDRVDAILKHPDAAQLRAALVRTVKVARGPSQLRYLARRLLRPGCSV